MEYHALGHSDLGTGSTSGPAKSPSDTVIR